MDTEKRHSIFSKVRETFLSILFTSLHLPSSCHLPSLNNSATILQITWRHGTWDSVCLTPQSFHWPLPCPWSCPRPTRLYHQAETRDDSASDSLSNSRGSAGRASPLIGDFSGCRWNTIRRQARGLLLTFRECHKGGDLERSPWVRSFPLAWRQAKRGETLSFWIMFWTESNLTQYTSENFVNIIWLTAP